MEQEGSRDIVTPRINTTEVGAQHSSQSMSLKKKSENSERVTTKRLHNAKRKVWKPGTALAKATECSLLGNKHISKWDDDEDANSLKQKEKKMREYMVKEAKEEERLKKRKMYLNHWDRALDEGKVSQISNISWKNNLCPVYSSFDRPKR